MTRTILSLCAMLVIFVTAAGAQFGDTEMDRDADRAAEAFRRSRAYLDACGVHLDPRTGLLPQRIGEEPPLWTPENSAADNFPFMVIGAWFTAHERAMDLFSRAMTGEKLQAIQRSHLPGVLELGEAGGVPRDRETDRLIFGASEYAKDGLVPMLEILGPGPWASRMRELVEGIFAEAPVGTVFGALPSVDAEVNGEMLQILCRLYWMTGREQYLEWARRIGDAYCHEVLPGNNGVPAHFWNFGSHEGDGLLKLRDHGCEIISGLGLLYAIEKSLPGSERAVSYYPAVSRILERVVEIAANGHGLLYNEVRADGSAVTGERLSDCWGYNFYAWETMFMATGEQRFRQPPLEALRNIHRYADYPWEPRSGGGQSQDGIADAVEGALGLLSHMPVESAFEWVRHEVSRMFTFQQESGILEGWWGDGNFCRTALMYAFFETRGTWCEPWREDIRLVARESGENLTVHLHAEQHWQGRLHFDPPRHREYLGMPADYPRINAFPEWYTVEPLGVYELQVGGDEPRMVLGNELIEGAGISLTAGRPLRLTVRPAGE